MGNGNVSHIFYRVVRCPLIAISSKEKIRNKTGENAKMCKIQFPFFHLCDGETKVIRFLDGTPYEFFEHVVNVDGKDEYLVCARMGCPLCKFVRETRLYTPRFVGVYPIISRKDEEKTDVFMLYKQGIKVLKFIDRQQMEGRLLDRDWEITRTGSGMDTVYNFIPLDKTIQPEIIIPNFKEFLAPDIAKLKLAADTIQI